MRKFIPLTCVLALGLTACGSSVVAPQTGASPSAPTLPPAPVPAPTPTPTPAPTPAPPPAPPTYYNATGVWNGQVTVRSPYFQETYKVGFRVTATATNNDFSSSILNIEGQDYPKSFVVASGNTQSGTLRIALFYVTTEQLPPLSQADCQGTFNRAGNSYSGTCTVTGPGSHLNETTTITLQRR